jgi:DNA polymerase
VAKTRTLQQVAADAGIERADVYVTNAVEHFKWKARGKRRLHDKPNRREIVACKQWLNSELELVDPTVIVVLGATAGQALFGSKFRLGVARDQHDLEFDGVPVVATYHPSAALRADSGQARDEIRGALVADLRRASEIAAPARSR